MSESRAHVALIKACLASIEDFEPRLRAWESLLEIGDIDYASLRLVPYLYRRAQSFGVNLRDGGIAKGLYLRSWYLYNTAGIAPMQKLSNLDSLAGAIVLKGAALRQTIYRNDPPTRPADDVDFLIPRCRMESAVGQLQSMEFVIDSIFSIFPMVNLRNSIGLRNGPLNVDLHWGINPICLDPDFFQRMFSRASAGQMGYLLASPTDNLIHTLIHGYGSNQIAPIRWILDAALLVEEGDIDWSLLEVELFRTGWGQMGKHQIAILTQVYDVKVPEIKFDKPKARLHRYIVVLNSFFATSQNIWALRITRLIGYDLAVLASGRGLPISVKVFVKLFPDWLNLFMKELLEYLRRP
jgi:hypothetical protein